MRIGTEPLVVKINKLFRHDLAAENDFLRAENRVLRELLPDKRPRLTERHRRLLVKYGMPIKVLRAVLSGSRVQGLSWHALKAIETHHNRHRPHQGLDNKIPMGYEYPDSPAPPHKVKCASALGGLLKHYYCHAKAA